MHKLLARQLGKAKASGEVDLSTLLELVSAAYEQSDNDRRRTDRSISLMIGELDQLNRGLERLVEERTAHDPRIARAPNQKRNILRRF